jgi:hypothetical protein
VEKGQIINEHTGRRMVMLGPAMLDPIFAALEEELGMDIPSIVIEAQRRFVKTGFYPLDLLKSEEYLRTQLALRGVGNVKSFRQDDRRVSLILHNPCLHLLAAGLVQGLFEMTHDVPSVMEWELNSQGDLVLEVSARKP